ncbi:MAG: penicillin acylase family protein [Candidatus Hodarchaeota archaeon]
MKKKLWIWLLSIIILFLIIPITPTNACGWRWNRRKITIIRDNYGVPHIYARTKEGLAFGCGYAMAQDRLWQADLYRRIAFGSLAEINPFVSIDDDYEIRTLGYSREELLENFENWEPKYPKAKLKEMMLAYIEGVNLYISEATTALAKGDTSLMPMEYLVFDVLPEPFTIEDSVAITVMMAWQFGLCGGGELGLAASYLALASKYGPALGMEIFNDLYPQVDPGAPTTIPSTGCYGPKCGGYYSIPSLPGNIGKIYKKYEATKMGHDQLLESMGIPTKFGSNAWMVNPWKSETGNAMQLGGPQMGHSTPQIVLEVGLHGAGIDAVGMMMPQAPSILIGVSQHGAWTSTTGSSDNADTYIEMLNPGNPYQYWYNGGWVDMEKRTEIIYGYKKLYSEPRDIYRTVHGPIIAWDLDNNLCYSMKVSWYKNELAAEEGWSLFQQAEDIWDMQEACKLVDLSHNFYWVDRKGNIGYWHSGKYPIKPTSGVGGRIIDDRFPLNGTGEEEWVGVTGFDEMPRCINPKQGYLANWNNKPIADWPYREADWGEVHGVGWIQEQLAMGGKISFKDMEDINRDTGYAHYAGKYFLDFLINAAKGDSSIPAEVIDVLEAWDWHYNDVEYPKYPDDPDPTYDDPGLTIFDKWFEKVDNAVFDDDLPPGVGGGASTLLHVFDGVDSKLPLNFDYLGEEPRDTLIVRVLKEALAELELEYGSSDVSDWLTDVRITKLTSQGALPTPEMHTMNRGTYNHIAEMPKWRWWHRCRRPDPIAVNVIPPGQSGFITLIDGVPYISPHWNDQLELYDTWTYKPVRYCFRANWKVRESVTRLRY